MPRLALILVGVLVLSGCAPTVDPDDDGVTRVVASTNVYGDIVAHADGEQAPARTGSKPTSRSNLIPGSSPTAH